MLRIIALAAALAGAVTFTGQAVADEAPRSFMLGADADTTADSVFSEIIAAGHDQLAAACEGNPGASVRVFLPLASGSYEDIQCSDILGGKEQTSNVPTGPAVVERTGEARQSITPVGPIVCGIVAVIESAAAAKLCADRQGKDNQYCNVGTFGNGMAWAFLCGILF